jgi:hypothetical protein
MNSNSAEKALEEARQAGFDLNLIDLNLALTPEERVLRHAAALALAQEMRKAGEELRAKSAPSAPTAG